MLPVCLHRLICIIWSREYWGKIYKLTWGGGGGGEGDSGATITLSIQGHCNQDRDHCSTAALQHCCCTSPESCHMLAVATGGAEQGRRTMRNNCPELWTSLKFNYCDNPAWAAAAECRAPLVGILLLRTDVRNINVACCRDLILTGGQDTSVNV